MNALTIYAMPHRLKNIYLLVIGIALCLPAVASAHQPRIVESRHTTVQNPEVSKVYYGKLAGEPDVYVIDAVVPFNLYVSVLVPDIAGQQKDVSAVILRNGEQIALLNGAPFTWTHFFEPFAYDMYWQGPKYNAKVEGGSYQIRVTSPQNDSSYSLAIGETEAFDAREGFNALTLIPRIKKDFFNESPIGFIRSPFGWGSIVIMYVLAGIFGLLMRFVSARFVRSANTSAGSHKVKNIGRKDRVLRFVIGIALLAWAITTSWSLILIFFSGLAFFEAFFSWCGFYAALGKNTCPTS